ncbi:MAG: hypothetical protein HQM04_04800 [Magnetococcales bacterium]|nr:hypothetical protein [Magnetococcales bacterium]MBF0114344.1 hypothetical protein [Magnetococcales bacterium]
MKKEKVHPNPFTVPVDEASASAKQTKVSQQPSKAAKVDEQLFQEQLAVSLEQEKPGKVKRSASNRKAAKLAAARIEQTTGNIVDEFESMIDSMLPSAKQERAACRQLPVSKKAAPRKKVSVKSASKSKSKRKKK